MNRLWYEHTPASTCSSSEAEPVFMRPVPYAPDNLIFIHIFIPKTRYNEEAEAFDHKDQENKTEYHRFLPSSKKELAQG